MGSHPTISLDCTLQSIRMVHDDWVGEESADSSREMRMFTVRVSLKQEKMSI